jgi:hypothetical protein
VEGYYKMQSNELFSKFYKFGGGGKGGRGMEIDLLLWVSGEGEKVSGLEFAAGIT